MHKLLPAGRAPRYWSPRLKPRLVRWLRPVRNWLQRSQERIQGIEVAGQAHLQEALAQRHGVLIAPNHYCYSDPYVLAHASDQVGRPFFYMAAWQAFGLTSFGQRMVMRWHGCFSVDRDGADRQAFKQAVDILAESPHPLVMFPEGDIYRVSDQVFPFREGCASMAIVAAKKATRPVVALPCALRYEYVDDVGQQLATAVQRLEQQLFLRPQPERPLVERVMRIAEGVLALKELDYLSETGFGALKDRREFLGRAVLRQVSARHGGSTTEERALLDEVRALRQRILASTDDAPAGSLQGDLDELFFVEQLACYPLPYLTENDASYRLAETLDKLEEDLLGLTIAKPRAPRKVRLMFGEPILIDPDAHDRQSLTQSLQSRVQALLDASCPATITPSSSAATPQGTPA